MIIINYKQGSGNGYYWHYLPQPQGWDRVLGKNGNLSMQKGITNRSLRDETRALGNHGDLSVPRSVPRLCVTSLGMELPKKYTILLNYIFRDSGILIITVSFNRDFDFKPNLKYIQELFSSGGQLFPIVKECNSIMIYGFLFSVRHSTSNRKYQPNYLF